MRYLWLVCVLLVGCAPREAVPIVFKDLTPDPMYVGEINRAWVAEIERDMQKEDAVFCGYGHTGVIHIIDEKGVLWAADETDCLWDGQCRPVGLAVHIRRAQDLAAERGRSKVIVAGVKDITD